MIGTPKDKKSICMHISPLIAKSNNNNNNNTTSTINTTSGLVNTIIKKPSSTSKSLSNKPYTLKSSNMKPLLLSDPIEKKSIQIPVSEKEEVNSTLDDLSSSVPQASSPRISVSLVKASTDEIKNLAINYVNVINTPEMSSAEDNAALVQDFIEIYAEKYGNFIGLSSAFLSKLPLPCYSIHLL